MPLLVTLRYHLLSDLYLSLNCQEFKLSTQVTWDFKVHGVISHGLKNNKILFA